MYNRIMLIGRLGKDPAIKYTQNQMAIGNFSIATTETNKGSDGERKEKTEWHNIVVFGKTAEHCSKYLSKGKLVYIEGKIQTRSWEDKDGNKKYTTEVLANLVQFLEKKDPTHNTESNSILPDPVTTIDYNAITSNFDDDDIPF